MTLLSTTLQKVENARQPELATKEDIARLERELTSLNVKLETKFKEIELRMAAEIAPLKWGVAVASGGVVALIIRSFIPH